MNKKRIFNAISIFFISTLLSSCNPSQNGDYLKNTDKIQFRMAEREIIIEDRKDIGNIMLLISKANLSNTLEPAENILKGTFFLSNGKQISFSISQTNIAINNKNYRLSNYYIPIMNILEKYFHDSKYMIQTVEDAESIVLKSQDTKEVLEIDDIAQAEIVSILKSSKNIYNENPNNSSNPVYPGYYLEIKAKNKTQKTIIWFVNEKQLQFQNNIIEEFNTDSGLWEYIKNKMPIETPTNPADIAYLFNATELIKPNNPFKGEYTHKINSVVRALIENSIPVNVKDGFGESDLILDFTINEKILRLTVYKDGFMYQGQYYESPDIYKTILSILNAG